MLRFTMELTVGVGAWTKIGLNNTDHNDQGTHAIAP